MSMLRLAEGRSVVPACERTDLRKGIDWLMAIIKNTYELDPYDRALYLFCGRRADRFKVVFFDEERGFVLVYVRLENGSFQRLRSPQEARQIDQEQYRRQLSGLQVIEMSTIMHHQNRAETMRGHGLSMKSIKTLARLLAVRTADSETCAVRKSGSGSI